MYSFSPLLWMALSNNCRILVLLWSLNRMKDIYSQFMFCPMMSFKAVRPHHQSPRGAWYPCPHNAWEATPSWEVPSDQTPTQTSARAPKERLRIQHGVDQYLQRGRWAFLLSSPALQLWRVNWGQQRVAGGRWTYCRLDHIPDQQSFVKRV